MTAKQFFKSTAFKCIVTLFAILLVCGVFLTVANGFLYVSEEERFDRAIKKIYGKSVTAEAINLDGEKTEFDYAAVTEAYRIADDGNYLTKVDGKEGFGGNVTCWVVVKVEGEGADGKVTGIMKVTIEKAPGESYISKISQSALDELAAKAVYGKETEGGFKHGSQEKGDDYVATGASYSMRAISNCLNGAMEFVAAHISGIVPPDFYVDNEFSYLELINKDLTSYTVENGEVKYTITTTGSRPTSAFTLNITVGETDGTATVNSLEIITSGSVAGRGKTAEEYNALIYKDYAGKNLGYLTNMLGEDMAYPEQNDKDISTGATRSSYNVAYACAFALANYEKCLEIPFEGGNA